MGSAGQVYTTGTHDTSFLSSGRVSASDMARALGEAGRSGASVQASLIASGAMGALAITRDIGRQTGAPVLDPGHQPACDSAVRMLDPAFCLTYDVVPWAWLGDTLVLAATSPDAFHQAAANLPGTAPAVTMALATRADIHAAIARHHGRQLAREAETYARAQDSCRDLGRATPFRLLSGMAVAAAVLAWLALAPGLFFAVATGLAVLTLVFGQLLKCAAFAASLARPHPSRPERPPLGSFPEITLLVPLLRERAIAGALLQRLTALTYPKSRLEALLILEQDDDQTRAVLDAATLPPWMRVIEVPRGTIQTKPRALNYALRFARGDIIGIYDAEDAPAPDQLDRVAARFARSPPEVACLQGILDYYNAGANWMSRCFAIEYAIWFRVLLPGFARLGLPIPLGGTTVFLRRAALDHLRGWDAHNVTEDADLGIRLARYGYRTELIGSVTMEEANNRPWPWIRQRSRWLKGYMMTWAVHSRRPLRLIRELGAWRALGLQVFFLTTLAQFLLAPTLWLFWLVLAGLPHPLSSWIGPAGEPALIGFFLLCEAIALAIGFTAVARTRHRGLAPWVITLFLYFPLGTIAAYKGLLETLFRPFYWDKTRHGHSVT